MVQSVKTTQEAERLKPWQEYIKKRKEEDYLWLLEQPAFRRFAAWLLTYTGVNQVTLDPQSNNMFYRMGIRHVGEMLREELAQVNLDMVFQLEKEKRFDDDRRLKIAAGILGSKDLVENPVTKE